MMSYSDDEKQTALLEFERSDFLSGGQKARSLEMVSAVLVREPDALFTLIALTTKKLLRSLSTIDSLLDELTEAADAIVRKRHPLSDPTALRDVAQLASSLQSSTSLSGIVPKVKGARLSNAINTAVSYLSTNLRGSIIYESRDAALRAAAQKSKTIVTNVEEVGVLVDNVRNALTNFGRASLENIVAVARLKRVSDGLTDAADGYENMSEYQRAITAKATILRLLAAGTTFQEVLSVPTSGSPRLAQAPSGSPSYKAVASGTGSYPSILGTESAPWPLLTASSTLFLTINGSSFFVNLLSGGSGILDAELTGNKTETFGISDDIVTPPALQSDTETFNIASGLTDMLTLVVDNKTYRIQLTSGVAQTAVQVADDINNDAAVLADTRVSASVVSGRVQLNYVNPSPPSEYGSRFMEVLTGQNDAAQLRPWRSSTTGNPAGTRSVGWGANNTLRIQANDDPDYVEVTLPSGDWPDYQVALGDTLTPGTIVYAIEQAAQSAGEAFSAEEVSSKLRIFSETSGNGSVITIRTDGIASVSGRGAQTLGFSRDQEDRKEDISSSSVVTALQASADFSAEAEASIVKNVLINDRVTVSSATEIVFDASILENPTYLTASPPPKIALRLPESDGVYEVSGYTYTSNELTIEVDRRLRDSIGVRGTAIVYIEQLKLTSLKNDNSADMECTGGPTTVLGLPTSQVLSTLSEVEILYNDPVLGWKTADLFGKNITIGDKFLEYSGIEIGEITSVDSANGVIGVSPNVSSSFERSVDGFIIHSGAAVEYEELVSSIKIWVIDADITELVSTMRSRLSRLFAAPTRDAATQAKTAISLLQDHLSALSAILLQYTPIEVSVVLVALQGLAEGGQDKARELLVESDYLGFAKISGKSTGMSVLRQAVGDFYSKDIGSERFNRRTAPRMIWVDATDPSHVFHDLELDGDDDFYTPDAWGDEEI